MLLHGSGRPPPPPAGLQWSGSAVAASRGTRDGRGHGGWGAKRGEERRHVTTGRRRGRGIVT